MFWVLPTIGALITATLKEIFKKKMLDHIEPIQFIILFYAAMFLLSQVTLPKVTFPSAHELWLIFIASIFYICANLFGLKAFKQMRISVFKPLTGLSPILVLVFAFLFLNEKITSLQSIGVMLVLMPIIYLAYTEYRHKKVNKKNLIYVIIAMLFEAGAVMFDRIIMTTLNPFTYIYFLKLILVIMLVIIMYLFYDCRLSLQYIKKNALFFTVVALITLAGSYFYLYAISDPLANIGIVKTVISSSLVFTTFFGGLYLKERHLAVRTSVALISIIGLAILLT